MVNVRNGNMDGNMDDADECGYLDIDISTHVYCIIICFKCEIGIHNSNMELPIIGTILFRTTEL